MFISPLGIERSDIGFPFFPSGWLGRPLRLRRHLFKVGCRFRVGDNASPSATVAPSLSGGAVSYAITLTDRPTDRPFAGNQVKTNDTFHPDESGTGRERVNECKSRAVSLHVCSHMWRMVSMDPLGSGPCTHCPSVRFSS